MLIKLKWRRNNLDFKEMAKKIKEVTDEMIIWKSEGTALYQQLPKDMFQSWAPCEPLRSVPENLTTQSTNYKTWNEKK